MVVRAAHLLWGKLSFDELKKFVLLGAGFFILIGSYWPLRVIKDAVFVNSVGPALLPNVKIYSLFMTLVLLWFYMRLVDFFSKERLIYFFVVFYSSIGLLLVYLMGHPTLGLAAGSSLSCRLTVWSFYIFVENYISLMVTLYWSFINDITSPSSAKKGYALIAFSTHLGGVSFTLLGNYLSHDPSLYVARVPIIAFISIMSFVLFGLVVWLIRWTVKKENLVGYKAAIRADSISFENKKQKISFWDGIKTMFLHPYVGGIFGLIFFYEIISTILNIQMCLFAKQELIDAGLVNKFIFKFSLYVQLIAMVFSFVGTSFLQRKFGIRFCLVAFPLFIGFMIFICFFYPSLNSIFYTLILSKALNYSFNQPAKEALYIPTSRNIKYKAKAWIDIFGARGAKAVGSGFGKLFVNLAYSAAPVMIIIVFIWAFLSNRVGDYFYKVIARNKLIH